MCKEDTRDKFYRTKKKKKECLLEIAQSYDYISPIVRQLNKTIFKICNQSVKFPDVQEPQTWTTLKYHSSLTRKFDVTFQYSKLHTLL